MSDDDRMRQLVRDGDESIKVINVSMHDVLRGEFIGWLESRGLQLVDISDVLEDGTMQSFVVAPADGLR